MDKIEIEHIAEGMAVYASMFLNVSNAAFLQSQLLARNSAFEYAFIDASAIISQKHLLAAVFAAITALTTDSLTTPNVHSEIVYSLSPTHNIAEAYRRFGITPNTRHVIVVKILGAESQRNCSQIFAHLREHVLGKEIPLTDENIERRTDTGKVTKYYKLGGAAVSAEDGAARRRELELHVLAVMALRGL